MVFFFLFLISIVLGFVVLLVGNGLVVYFWLFVFMLWFIVVGVYFFFFLFLYFLSLFCVFFNVFFNNLRCCFIVNDLVNDCVEKVNGVINKMVEVIRFCLNIIFFYGVKKELMYCI